MARTRFPKTKPLSKTFPLHRDKTYQSLTVEQQKFVYNIFLKPVTNWTNVQCYLDATTRNIKKSTANTYTSELLKTPKIIHCIKLLKLHYRRRLRLTPERILKEEASIALSRVGEFFDDNGYLICAPNKLPMHVQRAIKGFKRVRNDNTGIDRWEVELWDKGASLKRVQSLMGMNAPQQHKHKLGGSVAVEATIAPKVDLSGLSMDELQALKAIQEKLIPGTEEEEK